MKKFVFKTTGENLLKDLKKVFDKILKKQYVYRKSSNLPKNN
jgi:hypothetical protein